jgi:hypothetical protein
MVLNNVIVKTMLGKVQEQETVTRGSEPVRTLQPVGDDQPFHMAALEALAASMVKTQSLTTVQKLVELCPTSPLKLPEIIKPFIQEIDSSLQKASQDAKLRFEFENSFGCYGVDSRSLNSVLFLCDTVITSRPEVLGFALPKILRFSVTMFLWKEAFLPDVSVSLIETFSSQLFSKIWTIGRTFVAAVEPISTTVIQCLMLSRDLARIPSLSDSVGGLLQKSKKDTALWSSALFGLLRTMSSSNFSYSDNSASKVKSLIKEFIDSAPLLQNIKSKIKSTLYCLVRTALTNLVKNHSAIFTEAEFDDCFRIGSRALAQALNINRRKSSIALTSQDDIVIAARAGMLLCTVSSRYLGEDVRSELLRKLFDIVRSSLSGLTQRHSLSGLGVSVVSHDLFKESLVCIETLCSQFTDQIPFVTQALSSMIFEKSAERVEASVSDCKSFVSLRTSTFSYDRGSCSLLGSSLQN